MNYIYFEINNQQLKLDKDTNYIYRLKICKTKDDYWKMIKFSLNNGYLRCVINKKKIYKHRLVFQAYHLDFIISDSSSNNVIDHIDGNKQNNNINNLRVVTQQQNCMNQTRAKGYCWHKGVGKWRAQIMINGKNIHIGYYNTKQEARQAYLNGKTIHHVI